MHDYGSIAAQHYAAYRPPLHTVIVQEALGAQHFKLALDVGCGTGRSSAALLGNCNAVIAIDSSAEMIAQAVADPRIDYRVGDAVDVPVSESQIDLVSVAGALAYVDKTLFTAELRRICKRPAWVLVYDFKVETDEISRDVQLPVLQSEGSYDHSANLADTAGIETVDVRSCRKSFGATPEQVASVLLANEARFQLLSNHFDQSDPGEALMKRLRAEKQRYDLKATVWIALHQIAV
ncbi:MAG: class I SAM-dependent methyltransferase [Ruegeria sp.]